jgi:hypothetical protein
MLFKSITIIVYLTLVGTVVFHGTAKLVKDDGVATDYALSPAIFNAPEVTAPALIEVAAVEKINSPIEQAPSIEHMEAVVQLEKYKLEKKMEVVLFPTHSGAKEVNPQQSDEPVEFYYDDIAKTESAPAPVQTKTITPVVATSAKKGLSLEEADRAIAEINQQFVESAASLTTGTAISSNMKKGKTPIVADATPSAPKNNPVFNPIIDAATDPMKDYFNKTSVENSTNINFFLLRPMDKNALDKLRFKLDVVQLGNSDDRIHSTGQFQFETIWDGQPAENLYFAGVINRYFASVRFSVDPAAEIKEVPLLTLDFFQTIDPSFIKENSASVLMRIDQVPDKNIPFASLDGKTQIGNLLYLDNQGNVVEGVDATYVLIYKLPLGNVFVGQEDENRNTAMKVVHLLPNEVFYIDRPTQKDFSQVITFHMEHLMGKISQEFNLNLETLGGEFQNFQFRKINYNTIEVSSPIAWKDDSQYLALKQDDTLVTLAFDRNTKIIEVPSSEYVAKVYKDLALEPENNCLLQINFSEELANNKKIIVDQISSTILTKEIKGQTADSSLEDLESIVLDESGVYMKDEWMSPRKIFTFSEGTGEIILKINFRDGRSRTVTAPCAPGTYVVKTITP